MRSGAESPAKGTAACAARKTMLKPKGSHVHDTKGGRAISQLHRQRQRREGAHPRNGDHARPHSIQQLTCHSAVRRLRGGDPQGHQLDTLPTCPNHIAVICSTRDGASSAAPCSARPARVNRAGCGSSQHVTCRGLWPCHSNMMPRGAQLVCALFMLRNQSKQAVETATAG